MWFGYSSCKHLSASPAKRAAAATSSEVAGVPLTEAPIAADADKTPMAEIQVLARIDPPFDPEDPRGNARRALSAGVHVAADEAGCLYTIMLQILHEIAEEIFQLRGRCSRSRRSRVRRRTRGCRSRTAAAQALD